MLWLVVAAAIRRTIRRRLPFTLTWWRFTFPVGTCLLLGAWLVVPDTTRGSPTGRLFRPTSPAEPGPQSS